MIPKWLKKFSPSRKPSEKPTIFDVIVEQEMRNLERGLRLWAEYEALGWKSIQAFDVAEAQVSQESDLAVFQRGRRGRRRFWSSRGAL